MAAFFVFRNPWNLCDHYTVFSSQTQPRHRHTGGKSESLLLPFSHISEELLVKKVRQIFLYSLHDKTISQFRRMMTLEQFRSPKFAELLSKRYVDWMISYHAGIFRALVANGELRNEDPDTLAWMYVSPIIVLLSVCDRQPEREAESLAKLDAHVKLFFRTFNIVGGEK